LPSHGAHRISIDWDAPAILLETRPYAESDIVASVLTEAQGTWRGLVRGGAAKGRSATWQTGNLLQVRWAARLSDQLGSLSGELVHPAAALAMENRLTLAILISACATAEGALPEREPYPRTFNGLLNLIAHLSAGPPVLSDLIRWEMQLLADLGFGIDLTSCAVTGETEGLSLVSPRTGRAVSESAAGIWRSRLLPLPAFLRGGTAAGYPDWHDGLRLTGHFLKRNAFGHTHRPLPQARIMLQDQVASLAEDADLAKRR
jgi:DNA repair protein RecO (recombination protein O)